MRGGAGGQPRVLDSPVRAMLISSQNAPYRQLRTNLLKYHEKGQFRWFTGRTEAGPSCVCPPPCGEMQEKTSISSFDSAVPTRRRNLQFHTGVRRLRTAPARGPPVLGRGPPRFSMPKTI